MLPVNLPRIQHGPRVITIKHSLLPSRDEHQQLDRPRPVAYSTLVLYFAPSLFSLCGVETPDECAWRSPNDCEDTPTSRIVIYIALLEYSDTQNPMQAMATEVTSRSCPTHGHSFDVPHHHRPQHAAVLPIYIPGRAPRQTRACLLSSSEPANPDAVLSRSLMQQCRLDEDGAVDHMAGSPRASLKRAAFAGGSCWPKGGGTGLDKLSWKSISWRRPSSSSSSSSSPLSSGPDLHTGALQASLKGASQSELSPASCSETSTSRMHMPVPLPSLPPSQAVTESTSMSTLTAALRNLAATTALQNSQDQGTGPSFLTSLDANVVAERMRASNRTAQRLYRRKIKDRVHALEMKAWTSAREAEKSEMTQNSLKDTVVPQARPISLSSSTTPLEDQNGPSDLSNSTSTSSSFSTLMSSSSDDYDDDMGSPCTSGTTPFREMLLDRLMDAFYALPVYGPPPPLLKATTETDTKYDGKNTRLVIQCAEGGNEKMSDCYDQPQRGANKQQCNGKRRMDQYRHDKRDRETGGGEDDEGDDNDGKRPQAKKSKIEEIEQSNKRLACPFFKHNPQRYQEERSCVGPGWKTVHRLNFQDFKIQIVPTENPSNWGFGVCPSTFLLVQLCFSDFTVFFSVAMI
ncbi:hypothetical protein BD289DRAFT_232132 [Coniella lustricola]|uniref:BZIP domain-containing protein n=1 Tax=Coniella lustricola TaxID=2025994 RepID=A0A2T3AA63_9PEZI|nr:hypothetical protein BD289DRAFT_232132 [Coniella lustricola]